MRDECTCELYGSSCVPCSDRYTINRGLPGAPSRSRVRGVESFLPGRRTISTRQSAASEKNDAPAR